VCAFVVPRDGVAGLDPGALAEFMLSQDMAKAKVPSEWHVVDTIPTTASGKAQKHLLREARSATA
jgi:acyl-coenzyme A synthetase/AMP-(fatty) acid ligase